MENDLSLENFSKPKNDPGYLMRNDYVNELAPLSMAISKRKKPEPLRDFLKRYGDRGEAFSQDDLEKNKDLIEDLNGKIEALNQIIFKYSEESGANFREIIKKPVEAIFQVIYGEGWQGKFDKYWNLMTYLEERNREKQKGAN